MLIGSDIETGPLPDEELLQAYEAPEKPREFDPSRVDLGRAKKQETIDAKIAEARAEFEHMTSNWTTVAEGHKAAWLEKTREKAALSPLTGRVLAIGFVSNEGDEAGTIIFCNEDEGALLEAFWDHVDEYSEATFVFHNGDGFDLPFIVRRCWLLDVTVPDWAITWRGGRVHFDPDTFADTMRAWTMGGYNQFVKLDDLARAFGVEGKLKGCSGGDFARMFHGTQEERETALRYLEQDCKITLAVARRIGLD